MHVALRDAAATIALVFAAPVNRIHAAAEGLRDKGRLARSPGLPLPLSTRQIALLILAAIVGPHADRVLEYAESKTPTGQKLLDAIAMAIEQPALVERLQVDLAEPSVLVTTAAGDCRFFGAPGAGTHVAIYDGSLFAGLVDTLKSMPPRHAGRPSNRAR